MKRVLAVLAILMMITDNAWAQDKDNKNKIEECFVGTRETCVFKLDPDWGIGVGVTGDSEYRNGTPHFGGWVTPLRLGKQKYIRFAGLGVAFDLYDFSNHPADVRDLNRSENGFSFYLNGVLTFVPVQAGPFAYQFTISNDIYSLGVNRGRLHMLTVDLYM